MKLRPYNEEDAATILSWCQDERTFYQWTAGVIGNYPITNEEFKFIEKLTAFIAYDENGIIGFFTLRNPNEKMDELRFGFVIVNPQKRGKGYGKEMLRFGLEYAFDKGNVKAVSLGVFENNEPAYYCYKAVGFEEIIPDSIETYHILGEDWKCKEMRIKRI